MIVAISEAKCLRTKPFLGVLIDGYEERFMALFRSRNECPCGAGYPHQSYYNKYAYICQYP